MTFLTFRKQLSKGIPGSVTVSLSLFYFVNKKKGRDTTWGVYIYTVYNMYK